jgi:hypothetical protein
MATDSAGRVHLIVVGYPTGSDWMSLLHSVWDGRGWSAPSVITAAPPIPDYAPLVARAAEGPAARPLLSPPYPEYPRLAISRGNRLHLVWFGGDRLGIDREPLGVWYSSAMTDAPEIAPARSAAVGPPRPSRREKEMTAPSPPATRTPVIPAPAIWDETGEAMQPVDHHRWQEYPLLIGIAAVLPALLAMILARLRPFGRFGR